MRSIGDWISRSAMVTKYPILRNSMTRQMRHMFPTMEYTPAKDLYSITASLMVIEPDILDACATRKYEMKYSIRRTMNALFGVSFFCDSLFSILSMLLPFLTI